MTLNEKAGELRTSGWALTICGGAGLIIVILVLSGVLPLNLYGVFGIVTKVVMSLLFVLFLVIGLVSLKRSGAAFEDAKRETEKKEEIKKWFLETYSAEDIDEILRSPEAYAGAEDESGDETAEPEELGENDIYFARTDLIKDKICERFMDIEDALMSNLTEEIYNEIFDGGEEISADEG